MAHQKISVHRDRPRIVCGCVLWSNNIHNNGAVPRYDSIHFRFLVRCSARAFTFCRWTNKLIVCELNELLKSRLANKWFLCVTPLARNSNAEDWNAEKEVKMMARAMRIRCVCWRHTNAMRNPRNMLDGVGFVWTRTKQLGTQCAAQFCLPFLSFVFVCAGRIS